MNTFARSLLGVAIGTVLASPAVVWGQSADATLSYTYADATQNRDINEHYLFDASSIEAFPFIVSNAAAKHRVVTTGTYAAPWGLVLAGKFTGSSPVPRNVISCLAGTATFPTGAACTAVGYDIGGTGYKSLDLQVTKNLEVGDLGAFYLRLDGINVTNARNLVDYADIPGPDGLVAGGRYNPTGNITGLPRTLRASFGVRF